MIMQNNELIGNILILICPLLLLYLIFFVEEEKRKLCLNLAIGVQILFFIIIIASFIKNLIYPFNNIFVDLFITLRLGILGGYLLASVIIFIKMEFIDNKKFKLYLKIVTITLSFLAIIIITFLAYINAKKCEAQKYIYVTEDKSSEFWKLLKINEINTAPKKYIDETKNNPKQEKAK